MNKFKLTFFGLFFSSFLFSQILIVNSGSSISIPAGSSIVLDGLEIDPDATYVINGFNAVLRASTAITAGENSSVSRVFNTTDLLADYTGTLTFSYLDVDLNDIAEENLALELQAEDDSWTSYTGAVDETNKTVSYTFSEAVSFKAITAASSNATLTATAVHAGLSSILVYPNPTADRIYIKIEKTFNAELFDLTGRKIQQTNQKQLDMSSLSSGVYILNLTTENNKIQSFKILKK
jgi:hypothetical protein